MPESITTENFLKHFSFENVPTWIEVDVGATEIGLNRHDLRNKWVVWVEEPEEYEGHIYIEKWYLQRGLMDGTIWFGELFMDDTIIFDWRTARKIAKKFEDVKTARVSDILREEDIRLGYRA